MIWGYLSLLLCMVLLIKYLARRLKLTTANKLLKKWHIHCGVMVLVISLIHLAVTMKVWEGISSILVVSGIITFVVMIGEAFFYMNKKRLGKKWFPYHQIGAALCLVMTIIHIGVYFVDLSDYKGKMREIELSGIVLNGIKDGSYIGSCDVGFIHAKVQVEVEKEQIKDIIILEHYNERGQKAESILEDIVREQNTDVDAISGATNSSMVLKKAVENALTIEK